jgi:ketosteroid isomerase-like protein
LAFRESSTVMPECLKPLPLEEWDDYTVEILEVADLGDHVMVTQISRGRGKGSGVQVEMPFALLFSVCEGKITEWRIFAHEEEALQDAGLSG